MTLSRQEYATTLNELRDKEKEIERRRLLREDSADDIVPTSVENSGAKQETEIQTDQITIEQLLFKYIESRNDVRHNTKLNYQYYHQIIQRDVGNWILEMLAKIMPKAD